MHKTLPYLLFALAACAKAPGVPADFVEPLDIEPSPPALVCEDPTLEPDDLCFPAQTMEEWLRTGTLRFVGEDSVDAGISGLMKLLTGVTPKDSTEELFFYVKWKPANATISRLNNNPRKERAAYEIQKLFLDGDRWVVPPTVMRCMDVVDGRPPVDGRVAEDEVDCVWGQVSYWVSPLDNPGVIDTERLETDADYLQALGDLNILMYVIGHGDAHKDNWLISEDPDRMRAVSPDNGVAFSGPPNFFIKNVWGSIVIDPLPADTVERLRSITDEELHRLHHLETWHIEDRRLVRTDTNTDTGKSRGVQWVGDELTVGLRPGEIGRVRKRIDDLLERVDSGDIQTR